MGKKIFSLCMTLVLCLSLLPATALAAAPIGQVLYVGGVQISSTGYWTTDSDGNVTASTAGETPTDNYISYDAENNVLTLHNATIKKGLDFSEGIQGGTYINGSAIGVFNESGNAELTISLVGTNTIEDVSRGIFVLAHSSSTGGASLTITGSGSLNASGFTNPGILVQSNNGDATLSIENAKVTATSSHNAGVVIQSSDGSDVSLTVDGGNLTATGSGVISRGGIEFQFGSSESSTCTPTVTVSGNAIVRANGSAGGITSSSSTEVCTAAGTGETGGIVFDNGTGTVYGSVTLQENLTVAAGETLTIPQDAALTIPEDKTLTNNGTITNEGALTNNGTLTVEQGGTLTGDVTGKVVYAVTVLTSGSGSATASATTAEADDTVTLTASPSSGSHFERWEVISGGVTINGNQFTMPAQPVTVRAVFESNPYIPPTYAVTAPETPGGTVTVNPSRASRGRTVTITAEPDPGYELESLTVLDSRGNEIALTDKGDGKYTFTMPASKVTVESTFAPTPLPFEDVASGTWYEEAVRYVYFRGVREGMSATTFQPNGTLSRAMAVQIFYNLEGQPDISGENLGYPYEDVNAQAWYGDAVYWARITGVATGYGDGTFQPTDSITRQEFAQMLYNYAKYKGYDLSAKGDLSQFPDSGSVADWAEAAMSWANGNELINGHDDGTIDAAGIGTRAQAASILMRFDQNLVEK